MRDFGRSTRLLKSSVSTEPLSQMPLVSAAQPQIVSSVKATA